MHGRQVYIKVFHFESDEDEYFNREIAVLNFLENEGFPTTRIFEVGICEYNRRQIGFFVLDRLPGRDLFDLAKNRVNVSLSRDTFTFTEIMRKILLQVIQLLDLGIIHSDLRLPNIIYYEGHVTLIDFGHHHICDDSLAWKFMSDKFPIDVDVRKWKITKYYCRIFTQLYEEIYEKKLDIFLNENFLSEMERFKTNENIIDVKTTKQEIQKLLVLL